MRKARDLDPTNVDRPAPHTFATKVVPQLHAGRIDLSTRSSGARSGNCRSSQLDRERQRARQANEVMYIDEGPRPDNVPDLGFCRGAGDGNRTRTVSLGIAFIKCPFRRLVQVIRFRMTDTATLETSVDRCLPVRRARNGHGSDIAEPNCPLVAQSDG